MFPERPVVELPLKCLSGCVVDVLDIDKDRNRAGHIAVRHLAASTAAVCHGAGQDQHGEDQQALSYHALARGFDWL